jgi:tetratricopeptide (TPR) repeat protein
MSESDITAYAAFKAAKSGQVEEARALLGTIAKVDPRPPLYWLALFECTKASGDLETAYNSLRAFQMGLFTKYREQIGFGAGAVDQEKLVALNGPLDISNEQNEADVHLARGNFEQAIESLTKVVYWRIDRLHDLGYDVFPSKPEDKH